MSLKLCVLIAKKHSHQQDEIGAICRGYLDGRNGSDPREQSPEYEQGWLDGAGDREFVQSRRAA